MQKPDHIRANEGWDMLGAVQSMTDPVFCDWLLAQPEEYLAAKTAFEVWQDFKIRTGS